MTQEATFDLDQANRWFAVELNNRAWDLIEQDSHTEEAIETLLHTAHASCWHWRQIGSKINVQRAYCLLATAYAVAGYGEPAVQFAEQCRTLSDKTTDGLTAFDRASAYGCSAGAASLAGEDDQVEMWQQRMEELAASLPAEERALLERLYG